jgi:cellulose synthase/poly-beta-1,6-N-acetylglucosamine synthase-like glycosyltransferase/peptidoglycan/xylan/chitin deacetylase (PgdA/CDA1 family)
VIAMSFGSALLVGAYANNAFRPEGGDLPPVTQSAVPTSIQDGGPIIDTSSGNTRSYRIPDRTIALTFDDGPDERWTPEILRVLRKHQVRGTFFLLGSNVARHPDIARRLVEDGNEVGLHTFTHPNLSRTAQRQQKLELSLNQLMVVGATGTTTSLVRQPYSSVPSALDNNSWPVVRHLGNLGYLTVLTDNDSRDWSEKNVSKILELATPPDEHGSVVLWHDAGGDRSRTVAALDQFIPKMRAQGFRFVTVSQGLEQTLKESGTSQTVTATTHASRLVRLRGQLVLGIVRLTSGYFGVLWWAFLLIGALTICRTLAMFVFAGHHAYRGRTRRRSPARSGAITSPPVSVIVPAYNEAKGIGNAVRSLATSDYPTVEVIVVDDGSTDGTAEVVRDLCLDNVTVISTPNGGKPSALNIGIRQARHDIVIMVDGDTVFEPTSIRELVKPFADPAVGAVSGNVKIGNRRSLIAHWQHIEYVIGFSLDRRMYDTLRCMPTVPGAIGAYRSAVLRDVGGVSHDTLAEDTDLTMAICRAGWRVVYQDTALAWTEAPTSLSQLWKQRYRWCYGTLQAMWKHRAALGERSVFGLIGLPALALFGIVLPLLAPLLDILALYGVLALHDRMTVTVWLGMLGLQAMTAAFAFLLDGERLRPLWALPLQQFVYRQVMYLVAARSVATAIMGVRLRWHALQRHGISLPAESHAAADKMRTPSRGFN